jgi:hypothetical protein
MTDPIDEGRRAALKIGGGAGLGAFLLRLAGGGGVQAKAMPALVPSVVGGRPGGLPGESSHGPPSPEHRWLGLLRRRQERSYHHRVDGFEPSLAALRSVSPAVKAIIQNHRDNEAMTLIDEIDNRLLPNLSRGIPLAKRR